MKSLCCCQPLILRVRRTGWTEKPVSQRHQVVSLRSEISLTQHSPSLRAWLRSQFPAGFELGGSLGSSPSASGWWDDPFLGLPGRSEQRALTDAPPPFGG